MNRRHAALATAFGTMVAGPALAAELSGEVRERDTGRPVAGAVITVVGADRTTTADGAGAFRLSGVAAGTRRVKVEAPGYAPFVIRAVPLADDRPVVLRVALRREVAAGPELRVSASRPSRLAQTETSRRSLAGDEIKRTAGARNDPILAIANTAGVKSAGFSGAPAVRGGGPRDNRYFLDGIEIGNPYHFGGLVSVFNAETISRVDLYTGALPARFGNALSAIVDVETRRPRQDGLHGSLDSNLLYSEALLEGPLGPEAGLSIAARRSYFDVVAAPLLATYIQEGTVLPYFTDYQARFNLTLPGSGRLDMLAVGAQDSARVVLPGGGVGRGIGEVSLDSGFRSAGGVWLQPLGDTLSNRLTANYQEPFTDIQAGRFFNLQDYRFKWTLADEVAWQAAEQHMLRGGLRYDTINYLARRNQPDFSRLARGPGGPPGPGQTAQPPTPEEIDALPRKTTDTGGNQKVYGAYVEDAWTPQEGFTVSLGLRYDELQSTAENRLAPRGGLSWRLDPDSTVRLGYGQQYQFPAEDQLLPGTGNPLLRAAFSKDYVAGLDRQLSERLFGRLEVYYRNLFGLIEQDEALNFENSGGGRSYGAETTLELSEWEGWSGSLALTLARATRLTEAGAEIPYDYDQPIVANLLAQAPPVWGWSPSLKLRYSSGRPFTPVVDRKQEPNGTWTPIRGDRNSAHFPDGITWSARFERPLRLFGLDDGLYLEVTQQREALGVDYGPDYERLDDPRFNFGLPPLPYLGYRVKF